ncbi:hypothetical protein [Streptomyces pluripotens]|nr:hypothetical protein [Streptomyces pluripotens]
MIGRKHFGAGARFFVPRVQLTGDALQFVNLVPRDRHPQREFFAGAAIADLQTEGVIELALPLFGHAREVHLQAWERVEQGDIVSIGCGLGGFESGQLLGQGFSLAAEGCVLLANVVPECPLAFRVWFFSRAVTAHALGESLDEAALALFDGCDGLLQGLAFPGDAFGRIVSGL